MIKTPRGFFCSFEHAASHGQKKAHEAKERQIMKEIEIAEDSKKNIEKALANPRQRSRDKMTIKQLENWAQKPINDYVRLRDKGKSCPSCGKSEEEVEAAQGWKTGGAWDAGHFMSRGAKNQLRFNLNNIHRQCKSCNAGEGQFSFKRETVGERFEEELIKRIGPEKVEALKNNNELSSFSRSYLERIHKIFSRKVRIRKKLSL